jgi:hypothetical protein
MADPNPPVTDSDLQGVEWRTSSFSSDNGESVEVAHLADGRTAVRNSRHPELGVIVFTPAEMDAWIKGVKAGEFDDIA